MYTPSLMLLGLGLSVSTTEGILRPLVQQIWQDEATEQGGLASGDVQRDIETRRKETRSRRSSALATKEERNS